MAWKLIGKHEKDPRACRDVYAATLKDMMGKDTNICYVDCDLMNCVKTKQLRAAYPERAFEAGIAEGNAAGIAAGLAAAGKTVFLHSFGTFSSRKMYDQIYLSAAYADLDVCVIGSDPGVSAALNGGTHMPFEDGALFLSIPNTTVVDVADCAQVADVLRRLPAVKGVSYTRFVRKGVIQVYEDGSEFPLGKGIVLHESAHDEATVFASGIMVDEALKAREILAVQGIPVRVIDLFTWKPLDEELVLRCAEETGAVVTAENHNLSCGLGSVVANFLAQNRPTPQEFVGIRERFGQVGPVDFLMEEYGLRAAEIVDAVKRVIARKK